VWDVLLVGGVVYVRFLRGRVGWPRSRTPSGTHGTARWGDGRGLLRVDTGRLVGRLGGRLLRYAGDGHLLTIGPTRSGKGVSAVIPNLLTHRGSVVVTDLKKGETHAVTMAYRAADLGQRVVTLDPFGLVSGADCYNPLELVDPSDLDAAGDAAMIAEMPVVQGSASGTASGHDGGAATPATGSSHRG
jgi:type IV secretion system protein VirD4